MDELSIDLLTVQIGFTELLLALFFVLSLYGESLDGHGFAMVLSTIALQAPSDSTAESSNIHDDCTLILALGCC